MLGQGGQGIQLSTRKLIKKECMHKGLITLARIPGDGANILLGFLEA